MNKKILVFITLIFPMLTWAHTILLNVFDNEDGTITIEGVFNTGEAASGAQVRLEALNSGTVLYKKRLPDESELTIKIPKEPYQIVLDAGPGHQIVQDGIEPQEGFVIKKDEKKQEIKLSKARNSNDFWSPAIITTIALAFVLLFISIIISIRNTTRIIEQMNKLK